MLKKVALLGLSTSLALIAAPSMADEAKQNCILKGVVNKTVAEQRGLDVYVDFKSAKPASRRASCDLSRGQPLLIEEAQTEQLQDLPHGTRIAYQYTVAADNTPEWRLLTPSL